MTLAAAGTESLPLSSLLSQALVAFTIEFDNAAELQIPHSTTNHDSAPNGVWLTSMAMWLNCMRYVGTEPITLGEVARLARTGTNLDGMRRWGYITVDPGKGDPKYKARNDALVLHATRRGMLAREVWAPLTGVIEQRWVDRFGADHIGRLRIALAQLAGQFGPWLPDCMPILGFGLYSRGGGPREDRYREPQEAYERSGDAGSEDTAALPLPWLLARVLLAFAIAYERESKISIAIAANILRVLDESGVRVRDLPGLTGVSKEATAIATRLGGAADITHIGTDPDGGRWRVVRLTPKGVRVRDAYSDRVESLEARWRKQYGADVMTALRTSLEHLVGTGRPGSLLFAGIEPGPGNWRSDIQPPSTLPHFPMVSHR
ncbi:MAG: hypothetical protein J2P28_10270, partial [Actinobacteria bacterium]|nr:hypothetical protein [Actinomycetota bacterium]